MLRNAAINTVEEKQQLYIDDTLAQTGRTHAPPRPTCLKADFVHAPLENTTLKKYCQLR